MKTFDFSETQLRELFIKHYSSNEAIDIFIEVPVFCRSVDLVIEEKRTSIISAIEFKLHDWKRALQQVQSVGICFDYLYICLPKPKTEAAVTKIREACNFVGVGLIFYESENNSFVQYVNARTTSKVWERERHRIVEYLEARRNETGNPENSKV